MRSTVNGFLTRTIIALVAAGVLAGDASAQLKKEKKKPPATAQPGDPNQPAPAGTPAQPVADKVLIRDQPKDWTVRVEIHVQAGTVLRQVDKAIVAEPRVLQFNSVAIVFPVLDSSAAHQLQGDPNGGEKFTGQFFFNDALVDDQPTIADGYQSGTKLARWEGRNLVGKEADLKLQMDMNCFETRYDEKVADTIPWPQFWPPVAQSAFKPQMFVDYLGRPDPNDTKTIQEFVKKATDGKDPKLLGPSKLAKFLAGQVLEAIQPSGDGLLYNSVREGMAGTLKGFDLKGAAQTIRDGRGSEHDIACVTAAVYKAAGLPARTVIGWDMFDKKGDDRRLGRKGVGKGFRSWVEFCLVDPVSRQEIWVPVDVYRMRKAGSRAKPLDEPWNYFGTNDELAYVMPLAFHYHPPTTVVNIVPCLWGWLTSPESEPYANTFNFVVFRAARTSENPGPGKEQPPRR